MLYSLRFYGNIIQKYTARVEKVYTIKRKRILLVKLTGSSTALPGIQSIDAGGRPVVWSAGCDWLPRLDTGTSTPLTVPIPLLEVCTAVPAGGEMEGV